ncbi:lysozyme inhibitor LprI family protein [Herbaspirillum sp. YR522]|uniref:lysozyme inhibitor LprI family protein n=1 Tax=Herbaspirillum sp. YR522 TaxID=1144342 RepID=UPI00026FC49E|nr:lysozyme inhibitor LprI family protein [Herbaspirillum sp. YR522]EJN07613.1 hypothetical protein PMI40_01770 [Herbaspirillum sp. YR522]
MRTVYPLIGTALWLMSFSAAADDCAGATTQGMLNQCASRQFAQQDAALNRTYGQYRKKLNDRQKKQLTDAQQAWIVFRDKACAFEASATEGGSAYSMVLANCKAAKTAVRVKELKALDRCKEGDLECPAF